MPKVRKEIPELEKLVQVGRKKFFRYEEGAQLYLILSILVYTFFSRTFDLMLPPVAKHSIVVA